jgi:hypothetical protein
VIDETFTSVGDVSELADPKEFDKVRADRGPQEFRVEFSDTVDLARACDAQNNQFDAL